MTRPDIRPFRGGAAVASGVDGTRILGPFNLLGWANKSVQLVNHGSVTLSGAIVRVSNDPCGVESGTPGVGPADGLFAYYDTATFTNLAAGQTRATTLPGSYRWWDVVGISNQSATINVSGYGMAVSGP